MTVTSFTTIRDTFDAMRQASNARHRDIANQLGLSEGELVAAHATGEGQGIGTSAGRMKALRLRGDWAELIEAMGSVGDVMALTRNESCVHEKVGTYLNASHQGKMGLVLGGAIDLRIFYSRWAHGFAVDEATDKGTQSSLQFFDASGMAVHKIFLRPGTDAAAWRALIAAHASEDQVPGIAVVAGEPRRVEAPDAEIDAPAFREAWAAMRDTHEFFGLLSAHGVTRTQALRLADPQYACPVETDSPRVVLETAAADRTPIMVFVGNPGIIQIHSGPVQKTAVMGPWLNVLDEGFNLHLRADHVASAWVVRKPTSDGLVTSLELFDAQGETIAMFFGERKPGKPELASWRALTDAVANAAKETAPC